MTDQGRTQRGTSKRGPVKNRVLANGIDISYLEWSARQESAWPPVLLLHGILQTGAGMANLAAHLARQSRVVVPDMRGRGETASGDGAVDPGTLADDMAALIRAVKLEGAVVIGRMHGGVVGYHLAARHPSLIAGLVIGDTPPAIDEAHAERSLRLIRELPASFTNFAEALAYYQDVLQLSEGRARYDIPLDLTEDQRGSLSWRHDLKTIERIEAAASPRSDWPVLRRITCPTLMIRGQRGAVPPAMADRICQEISHAPCRVQTVIGARHDVFLGSGCEQAFGAIDIMLTGLANSRARAADGTRREAQDAEGGRQGRATIERIIRVIQSGDADSISAIFDPDCHIVQYGEGGKLREGGIDAVQAAFSHLFARQTGQEIDVRDVIESDGRLACVFVGAGHDDSQAVTSFTPVFFRFRDQLIVNIESYRVTIPAGDL